MKSKNATSKIFTSMNKSNKSVSNTNKISIDKITNNRIRQEDYEDNNITKLQRDRSRSKERPKSKIRNIKDTKAMSFDLGNSMVLSKSYYTQTYGNKEYKKLESKEKKLIPDIYVKTKEDLDKGKSTPHQHRNSTIVSMENPMNKLLDYNNISYYQPK